MALVLSLLWQPAQPRLVYLLLTIPHLYLIPLALRAAPFSLS
jgi:hypothetical protein